MANPSKDQANRLGITTEANAGEKRAYTKAASSLVDRAYNSKSLNEQTNLVKQSLNYSNLQTQSDKEEGRSPLSTTMTPIGSASQSNQGGK